MYINFWYPIIKSEDLGHELPEKVMVLGVNLVAFRDQIGIFSQPGALPGEALEDLISQIEGLDMDAIREEIASEEAKADADATA